MGLKENVFHVLTIAYIVPNMEDVMNAIKIILDYQLMPLA
jgi:hypothetical protein